jgi:hypothetical protein
MPPRMAEPVVMLSAMNPGARPYSTAANRSRDAGLRAQLRRRGLCIGRSRGWSAGWSEDGWLVPAGAAPALLRQWGQLAGMRWDAGGIALLRRWGGMRRWSSSCQPVTLRQRIENALRCFNPRRG